MRLPILSRGLLPALVIREKETGLPDWSFRISPSLRKPPTFNNLSAASASCGTDVRLWSNQSLFAGLNSPNEGLACPRKATRARSVRLMAIEMAFRKFRDRNQALR